MFSQAYIVTFFLASIILVVVLARNFFTEFAADKDNPVSFWAYWIKFPSVRDCVREEVRTLLVGLYYIQLALLVGLGLSLILGDYSL